MGFPVRARSIRRTIIYAIIYISAGWIFFLPLTMPILRSMSDFSIYNTGWNGCSQLARRLYDSGKEVFPLHTPFRAIRNRPEDSQTALFIIGPTRPFSRSDADFISDFAKAGGKVLLANDFDQGNSLLDHLDLNLSFTREPLGDLCFAKNPFVVTCSTTGQSSPLLLNVSSFTLNYPAAISGYLNRNATILATSSGMSWLDLDNDRIWDRGSENRGPFNVLISVKLGQGEVILLSDPSIFINGMITISGNKQLYDNLLSHLASSNVSRIYIDEEHHVLANPIEIFTIVMRRTPDWVRLITVWIIVTVGIFVIHPRLRSGGIQAFDIIVSFALRTFSFKAGDGKVEPPNPVERCLLKHPEWDIEMLRRIAKYGLG